MKISPTAIRQKVFETSFRGFEKKQVTEFLEEMSVAMEQINQENLDLRSRLQQVEAEAKRLKDVEDSLFRTLKTAEDTGAAIITEATEAADQIIAEANQMAEEATKQAQQYAAHVKEHADQSARALTQAAEEKANSTIQELRQEVQQLIKSYEGLADYREAVVKNLQKLAQEVLRQLELSESQTSRMDGKAYQKAIDELGKSNAFTAANFTSLPTAMQAVPDETSTSDFDQDEEESLLLDNEEISMEEQVLDEELSVEQEMESDEFEPGEEEQGELDTEEFEEESLVSASTQIEIEVDLPEEETLASLEEDEKETEEESPSSDDTAKKSEDSKSSSGSFFDQFD
ncbi:MAG: DivIVA domain-containing protein [Bacteroidota bacterium]